jgi:H+/Cl- antiporter ClcA
MTLGDRIGTVFRRIIADDETAALLSVVALLAGIAVGLVMGLVISGEPLTDQFHFLPVVVGIVVSVVALAEDADPPEEYET